MMFCAGLTLAQVRSISPFCCPCVKTPDCVFDLKTNFQSRFLKMSRKNHKRCTMCTLFHCSISSSQSASPHVLRVSNLTPSTQCPYDAVFPAHSAASGLGRLYTVLPGGLGTAPCGFCWAWAGGRPGWGSLLRGCPPPGR